MIRAFAASWMSPLIAHLWDSTLFLLIVLLAVALLRSRLTAGARCVLALIGIAKFAIPSAAFRSLLPAEQTVLVVPFRAIGGALQIASRPVSPSVWPVVAIGIWAAIALLLIVRFTVIRHRLVAIAVRTALPADVRETDALRRAVQRIRLRRSVDIVRAALPEAPAVLRIFRPLIVLPQRGCDDLSDDELESLLTHEVAHVARQDNLAARIESSICAFFWFHPLIWIAQRITVIERERACDEVVASTADERETYLTALTKFCHAAIAPRLPGVSCMATAKLKERMDHIMRFPALKAHAPSVARVTFAATAALIVFTAVSAFTGSNLAFARSADGREKPYSIRLRTTKDADLTVLHVVITDNATGDVLATPSVKLDSTRTAFTRTTVGDNDIEMDVRPGSNDKTTLTVRIIKNGEVLQQSTMMLVPNTDDPTRVYTGKAISLDLKDADLRQVLGLFGKITGLQMDIDPDVQGKVTVSWHDVPWDEAFDTLVKEQGLTWSVHDSVAHVSKK